MKIICILLLFFVFFDVSSISSEKITTPGVLIVDHDYLAGGEVNGSIKLLNKDFICIDSISVYPPSDIMGFRRDYKLRAYFPLYGIIIFDSMPINENYYKVNYDNTYGYISDNTDKLRFLKWDQFLLSNILIRTSKENPVRNLKSDQGHILDYNLEDTYMVANIVEDDWVYVTIFEGEEIEKTVGKGWLKWRDANNVLLITILYSF